MRTDCTILYLSCISSVKCNPKWSSYFHGNIRWHLGYTRSAAIIGSGLACKWLTCSLFQWAYRAIMYNTSYSLCPLCPYSASAVLPSMCPDPLTPASPQASHCHRVPSKTILTQISSAFHPISATLGASSSLGFLTLFSVLHTQLQNQRFCIFYHLI